MVTLDLSMVRYLNRIIYLFMEIKNEIKKNNIGIGNQHYHPDGLQLNR